MSPQIQSRFNRVQHKPKIGFQPQRKRRVKANSVPVNNKMPNAETRAAMAELEEGKGFHARSIRELFTQLEMED